MKPSPNRRSLRHGIVPGLLTAGLLTHLGGLWAFLATEMHFKFLAPVYVGDTITASAVIAEYSQERGWVRLECECRNAAGSPGTASRCKWVSRAAW